jgi:hypothetical protein
MQGSALLGRKSNKGGHTMPTLAKKGHTRRRLENLPAALLGRPRARLGNPNTGIPEVLRQPLYDIYFVAPGNPLPLLVLFSVPRNQNYVYGGVTAFSKGRAHTNISQAAQLQSSYSFMARALSVYVQGQQGTAHPGVHREDLENLLGSFVDFKINDKSYSDGIVAWLPGAGGASYGGVGSLTAPASSTTSTNGWPVTSNRWAMPGGQFINPQETFSASIDPTQNALAAGGNGAPSTLAAAGNPVGVPASGIGAWFIVDGTLIRVAQ